MNKLNQDAALVYVMVATASADKKLVDPELKRIGAVCDVLPIFDKMTRDDLQKYSSDCRAILATENGVAKIVAMIKESLPSRLQETAYALALDIAASDLFVPAEEILFLQELGDSLGINKLTVAALEVSAQVRARRP
jgi:tellurite resistance protein